MQSIVAKGWIQLAVLGAALYFAIDGIQILIDYSMGFITYEASFVRASRIALVLAGAIAFLLKKKILVLTSFGRNIVKALLIAAAFSFAAFLFCYTATDSDGVVRHRVWSWERHGWDEAVKATTAAYIEEFYSSTRRNRLRAVLEYRIHFKDGSSINVWDDASSLSKLDEYVRSKGIPVEHGEADPIILNNLRKYADGDPDVIRRLLSR